MTNGWHEGPGMSGTELERIARQAWEAWRDALRQTAPGASQAAGFGGLPGAMPGFGEAPADPWRSALDWWARQPPSAGQADVGDTVARFNSQARQWFGQMQQLAAQFAGRDDSAAQITAAWRQALGGLEANPFAKMFDGLQAPGLEGFDAWIARARPLLDAMQGGAHGADWLQLPTFGVAREHQERWQGLAQAMAGYQRSQQAYHALLARASQSAFGLFERKLGAHAAPGQQIESPRVLFDLWIDAAEEAYAEIALSPEFRSAYADLVNGQMRLRLAVQREIEQLCRQFDLPTRTELDGAHRKIAELERHLRRLRDRVDAVAPVVRAGVARGGGVTRPHADVRAASAAGSPRAARTARETSVRSAAVTAARPPRTTAKSAVPAKKPAAQKTAAKQVPAKKAAAKKAAPNKSAPRKTAKPPVRRTAATPRSGTKTAVGTSATQQAATKKTARKRAPVRKTAPSSTQASSAAARTPAAGAAPSAVTKAARAPTQVVAKAESAPTRTTRRTPVARPVPKGRRARAGRVSEATPTRAARKSARSPTRVAPLPNYGFISPIPLAPEPMTPARGKRARKGKR